MAANNDIVLFHYHISPLGWRVVAYLALRGIDYAECLQPDRLPRPDLDALDVNYRRSPVMAIGRDIYCDSRLILQTLEAKFPFSPLAAHIPEQRGIEKLFENWTQDGGVFWRSASLMPLTLPQVNDPEWKKDRHQMTGKTWKPETLIVNQKEGLTWIRNAFDLLETTFLADGRDWILGTEKPMLADIEALWPFVWLTADWMSGALPPSLISARHFPKTFAYIARFNALLDKTRSAPSTPKPATLSGADAVRRILAAPDPPLLSRQTQGRNVDKHDPLQLEWGDEVEIFPTDSGFNNKDRGALVLLNQREVALRTRARVAAAGQKGAEKEAGKEMVIHYPRVNVRIRATGGGGGGPKLA